MQVTKGESESESEREADPKTQASGLWVKLLLPNSGMRHMVWRKPAKLSRRAGGNWRRRAMRDPSTKEDKTGVCLLTLRVAQPARSVVKPLVDPYLVMQFQALGVGARGR